MGFFTHNPLGQTRSICSSGTSLSEGVEGENVHDNNPFLNTVRLMASVLKRQVKRYEGACGRQKRLNLHPIVKKMRRITAAMVRCYILPGGPCGPPGGL